MNSGILERIIADARYRANLGWGSPRRGHPEATIRAHIEELSLNLLAIEPQLSTDEFWKLTVLIHVHDTFKPDSHARRAGSVAPAILHPDSHASIARAFLAEFTDDPAMLAIVQYHDEPFALYRQWKHKGKYNEPRFKTLLSAIPDWDLFLAFVIIDGTTAGKATAATEAGLPATSEPRDWFLSAITQLVTTRWTVETVRMVEAARAEAQARGP
jgi:hypothetical protein